MGVELEEAVEVNQDSATLRLYERHQQAVEGTKKLIAKPETVDEASTQRRSLRAEEPEPCETQMSYSASGRDLDPGVSAQAEARWSNFCGEVGLSMDAAD